MKTMDNWIPLYGLNGVKVCSFKKNLVKFEPPAEMSIEFLEFVLKAYKLIYGTTEPLT